VNTDYVRDILTNIVAHSPNAVILELLSTRSGRKLSTLQLACVNTIIDRFEKEEIPLTDVVDTLRKADCFAVFLTGCLKNIQWVCSSTALSRMIDSCKNRVFKSFVNCWTYSVMTKSVPPLSTLPTTLPCGR
jgi:hypothetical protein